MSLLNPIWRTSDKSKYIKALEAVRKISDQEKLFEIALSAPLEIIQSAAVGQLHDKELLSRVIILSAFPDEGEQWKIWFFIVQHEKTRLAAIDRLNDQEMLKDLMLSYPGAFNSDASRERALDRITDEKILFEIADAKETELSRKRRHDEGRSQINIRYYALKRLRDPELIKQVAIGEGECARHAATMITDPEMLAEIVLNAANGIAASNAVREIKNIDVLFDMMDRAENGRYKYIFSQIFHLSHGKPDEGRAVLSQTQHERFLQALLAHTNESEIGYFSDFTSYEELELLALECQRKDVSKDAFLTLWKDPAYPRDRLLQIVIKSSPSVYGILLHNMSPMEIISRFTDIEDLKQIAVDAEWHSLRREAILKIIGYRDLPVDTLYRIYCDDESNDPEIQKSLRKRFENAEIDPDDLVRMTGNPEISFEFRILCLQSLFSNQLNCKKGIGTLRGAAAENILADIQAEDIPSVQWSAVRDRLSLFVRVVPEEICQKYGITFSGYEASDEDQFGRYTYTQRVIHYKGQEFQQNYSVHP